MRRRLEASEIRRELKNNGNVINEVEFLERTKIDVALLYNCAQKILLNENDKIKYSDEVIKKMVNNKDKFRVQPEIDRVSVQYAVFFDYIVEQIDGQDEKEQFLKINVTVNFYDDKDDNNERFSFEDIRCWNDLWIITYKKVKNDDKMFNCSNCGAIMQLLKKENLLKCDYCGNIKLFSDEWKIVDIEVKDGYGI